MTLDLTQFHEIFFEESFEALGSRPQYLTEGANGASGNWAAGPTGAVPPKPSIKLGRDVPITDGNDVGEVGFVNILGAIPMTRALVTPKSSGDAHQNLVSLVG